MYNKIVCLPQCRISGSHLQYNRFIGQNRISLIRLRGLNKTVVSLRRPELFRLILNVAESSWDNFLCVWPKLSRQFRVKIRRVVTYIMYIHLYTRVCGMKNKTGAARHSTHNVIPVSFIVEHLGSLPGYFTNTKKKNYYRTDRMYELLPFCIHCVCVCSITFGIRGLYGFIFNVRTYYFIVLIRRCRT